ncbi:MAG: hypothetical protein AAFQ95_26245 [Cyanobacteria bacterium J06621_3]
MDHKRKLLEKLIDDVNQHHFRLETKSVWLFLATLGCWSIGNSYMQLMAYFITLALFGKMISSSWKTKDSLPKRLNYIQKQAYEIPGESNYKKALLWDCHLLGKKNSLLRSPINVPTYVSIGFFYIASLIVSLLQFRTA